MVSRKIFLTAGLILLFQTFFICKRSNATSLIGWTKDENILSSLKNYFANKSKLSLEDNIIKSEKLNCNPKDQYLVDTLKNNLSKINMLIDAARKYYDNAIKNANWDVYYYQEIAEFELAVVNLDHLSLFPNIDNVRDYTEIKNNIITEYQALILYKKPKRQYITHFLIFISNRIVTSDSIIIDKRIIDIYKIKPSWINANEEILRKCNKVSVKKVPKAVDKVGINFQELKIIGSEISDIRDWWIKQIISDMGLLLEDDKALKLFHNFNSSQKIYAIIKAAENSDVSKEKYIDNLLEHTWNREISAKLSQIDSEDLLDNK